MAIVGFGEHDLVLRWKGRQMRHGRVEAHCAKTAAKARYLELPCPRIAPFDDTTSGKTVLLLPWYVGLNPSTEYRPEDTSVLWLQKFTNKTGARPSDRKWSFSWGLDWGATHCSLG